MSGRPTDAAGEPTVGAMWVRHLMDALTATGFDAADYCRRTGWNLEGLDDLRTRIPWRDVVDLWYAAARSTGDPHLGLRAAESLPFRVGGPYGYVVASSPTLLDGITAIVRYQHLHIDHQALAIEERGDHLALTVRLPPKPPGTSHQVEYICAVLNRVFTWAIGPEFRLQGVRFQHAGPASTAEHERIFGCPVEFKRPEHALLIARGMLSRPSLYANPDVLAAVQAIADRALAEVWQGEWSLRLKALLRGRLASPGRIGDIARELGVSRRSLQRRLADERVSFEKVLDECRRERALDLINQKMTIAVIAETVGFAGARPFVRAFRRWTGQSPSAYRARAGSEAAG